MLQHVWFVNGGGSDASRVFGHSHSRPVLRFGFVSVAAPMSVLIGCGVIDCSGKAIGALGARVTLDSIVLARVDTGGELVESRFTIRGAHVSEIPFADHEVRLCSCAAETCTSPRARAGCRGARRKTITTVYTSVVCSMMESRQRL